MAYIPETIFGVKTGPMIPSVHSDSLHGEMVAIGLLTQLFLEKRQDECTK